MRFMSPYQGNLYGFCHRSTIFVLLCVGFDQRRGVSFAKYFSSSKMEWFLFVSKEFGHANRNDSAVGERGNNGEKIDNCLKIRHKFFVLQDLLILYCDRELVGLFSKSGVGVFAYYFEHLLDNSFIIRYNLY